MTNPSDQAEGTFRARMARGITAPEVADLVWYASHLTLKLPPLEAVAHNLVEHGIAETAYLSDGKAWWSEEDSSVSVGRSSRSVGHGRVVMTTRADKRQATFNFRKGPRGSPRRTISSGQTALSRAVFIWLQGYPTSIHTGAAWTMLLR